MITWNTFHTSESESLLPEFWSVSLVKFWNVFHLAKVVWLSASDEGFDIFCFLQQLQHWLASCPALSGLAKSCGHSATLVKLLFFVLLKIVSWEMSMLYFMVNRILCHGASYLEIYWVVVSIFSVIFHPYSPWGKWSESTQAASCCKKLFTNGSLHGGCQTSPNSTV